MLFGIVSLIIVGVSWTLVGIVMGLAPKKNVDPGLIQLFGGIISLTVSLILVPFIGHSDCATTPFLLAGGSYMLSGFLNFIMLIIMAYAMQRGPNGIIWTIIQSAMIVPFLVGVLFFHVELTLFRILGMLCIMGALVIFGLGKDSSGAKPAKIGPWRAVTFLAFLITGVQQNLNSIPSYFESMQGMSSIMRTVFTAGGTCFGAVLFALYGMNREKWNTICITLKRPVFWVLVGSLQFFGLFFAYTLFYPGLDALANAGKGAISYPLLIGSCIVGFTLYSAFLIREKTTPLQYAALALCLLGILGIC